MLGKTIKALISESTEQSISSGDNANNLQAARDIIFTSGLSYTDARQMMLDIFHDNFKTTKHEAAVIAFNRAKELIDDYFEKLTSKHHDASIISSSPDLQDTIFNAQKAYAKSGDKTKKEILLDLLVNKTESDGEQLLSLIISEAIVNTSKITKEQIDIITFVYALKHAKFEFVSSIQGLKYYFSNILLPLYTSLNPSLLSIKHLESCGCLTRPPQTPRRISEYLKKHYQKLFQRGFPLKKFKDTPSDVVDQLIMPCIFNPTFYQIKHQNEGELIRAVQLLTNDMDTLYLCLDIYRSNLMREDEIDSIVTHTIPDSKIIFDSWHLSHLTDTDLTATGIIIGNANLKIKTGIEINLKHLL